jgi:predicted kinase
MKYPSHNEAVPPCLYLFTGISFAGKSVLARALAARLGAPRVDPDEVSHRFGLGLSGEFLSDVQWTQIHQLAEEEACVHLRTGTSVVYDSTAFTRVQRDALRDLATCCGATTRLIFVDTPLNLARQHWHANEQSPRRARVHADDFAMVADRFEPRGPDEGALGFTQEDDVDAWIAARFAWLIAGISPLAGTAPRCLAAATAGTTPPLPQQA